METNIADVLAERGSRYGEFKSHAMITTALKNVIHEYDGMLNDSQREALDMIAHKIGRILNGDPNYADSWIDIAGYAKLVADELSKQPEKQYTGGSITAPTPPYIVGTWPTVQYSPTTGGSVQCLDTITQPNS